ncbi:MAG: hypothetical protein QGF00_27440 [Planctomycetota bacterium]|jgi:hypothetical protein|nr:hypothetical protein [Planctomycetota bacterium]MDP7253362.1 hypothetical protein [Planctomycetota bacterium]
MLSKLKKLLAASGEEAPLCKLMKLLLREAAVSECDQILFGIPPEDRPQRPIQSRNTEVVIENKSGEVVKRFAQVHIPVWFRHEDSWQECEGIPMSLFAQLLALFEEHSSIPGDARHFDISHVSTGQHEGSNVFVQYQLCMEDNFYFYLKLLDVVLQPAHTSSVD